MRSLPLRRLFAFAALPLFVFGGVAACTGDDDAAPPVTPGIDSGSGYDAGRADGSSTPIDGGVDGAPAADAADAADAAPLVTTLPFATGLDGAGVALADGLVDGHWTVKDQLGAAYSTYAQTEASGFDGYWMRPSATSKFISPFVDTVDPTGVGVFTYQTTFVLGAEVDLAAAQLTLRYASDNAMSGIRVNGQALPAVAVGSYSAFETVMVTVPLVRGVNSVSFTVENQGGPTGLRAELDLVK